MKVSDLARKAGVATSAVRFYEAKGILPRAARLGNGYREYTAADLCRLRLVTTLRGLGLELEESGRLASLCTAGQCDEMAAGLLKRVTERRQEVARARAELDHLDARLGALELKLTGNARPNNAQWRGVTVKQLDVAVSNGCCDCDCEPGAECPCEC
jgi:DNA-binding transcriptional MerR regulator